VERGRYFLVSFLLLGLKKSLRANTRGESVQIEKKKCLLSSGLGFLWPMQSIGQWNALNDSGNLFERLKRSY